MFLLFLLCSIFVVCELHSPPTATVCFPKACFTWYREGLSFHETAKKCRELGGDLTTIRDQTELTDVESVFSQLNEKDIKFWIGLRLPKGNCTIPSLNLRGFKWISGAEDSQYSNWNKEPETTCTEERCVVVQRSTSIGLKWTDTSCRTKHFYLCRFYFKGTCPALSVTAPSTVSYTVPFSDSPFNQDNGLTRWPHGTYAVITCESHFHYTLCKDMNGAFAWTVPGPFCHDRKISCDNNKGGCEQLCVAGEAGFHCECEDRYQLGEDGKSCIPKNTCQSASCSYKCLTKPSGFECTCPEGFQLGADQFSCIDVNECLESRPCGDNICHNTNGSYTCECREGFTMRDGKCQDVDECTQDICPQGCLNSFGSFSCYCFRGFKPSDKGLGLSCVDIDECLKNQCEDKCTNTDGSYMCSCRPGFTLAANGISCIPVKSEGSILPTAEDPKVTQNLFQVPQVTADPVVTHSPTSTSKPPSNHSITHTPFGHRGNTSDAVSKAPITNSWVLICVLASVIPLVILIFLTAVIVIYRCNHVKSQNKKQSPTADSYCWVSSGLGSTAEKINGTT